MGPEKDTTPVSRPSEGESREGDSPRRLGLTGVGPLPPDVLPFKGHYKVLYMLVASGLGARVHLLAGLPPRRMPPLMPRTIFTTFGSLLNPRVHNPEVRNFTISEIFK